MKKINIIGIETSCDDTSIAVFNNKKGITFCKTQNQNKIHINYNGIYPEYASREHLKVIFKMLDKCFKKIKKSNISAIAYTNGPGLVGSLLIGHNISAILANELHIPLIPINHIEGHIMSAFINNRIDIPAIALIISGGHTILILIEDFHIYKILGQTLDDSIGEVFDKIACLLNFVYPGAKFIEKYAKKNAKKIYNFTIPLIKNKENYNFSYSGLKTAVKNLINKLDIRDKQNIIDIAYSFQLASAKSLYEKLINVLKKRNIKNIIIVGGVSQNMFIREFLNSRLYKYNIFYTELKYCSDNAAMIAYTGYNYYIQNRNLHVKPIDINTRIIVDHNNYLKCNW